MTLPPSLCIDLGASYTKIAYRDRPDATTHLVRAPELPDEHHFCIPSVAARNRVDDRWVFGVDAMDLSSGPRVEVFQNWKADLFDPDGDGVGLDVLDDAAPEAVALLVEGTPLLRAYDVAVRFLRWLHDVQLPLMLSEFPNYRAAEVQLCVPEFVLEESVAPRLEAVMRDLGYRNEGSYTLSEPKANLIGILTEGQNAVAGDGSPNIGAMFGDASVLRTLAQPGHAMLLVDIGAYTTDLALASLASIGGAVDQDPAVSARLGVRRLDDWVLESADPEARARVNRSAAEREHFHAMVYGGVVGPQPAEFGLTEAAVDDTIGRFTAAILDVIGAFLYAYGAERPFAAVLTGGGSNIRPIANRLASALAERGIESLHAPISTDAPAQLQKYALGPELVRGASAIGGCSILYR